MDKIYIIKNLNGKTLQIFDHIDEAFDYLGNSKEMLLVEMANAEKIMIDDDDEECCECDEHNCCLDKTATDEVTLQREAIAKYINDLFKDKEDLFDDYDEEELQYDDDDDMEPYTHIYAIYSEKGLRLYNSTYHSQPSESNTIIRFFDSFDDNGPEVHYEAFKTGMSQYSYEILKGYYENFMEALFKSAMTFAGQMSDMEIEGILNSGMIICTSIEEYAQDLEKDESDDLIKGFAIGDGQEVVRLVKLAEKNNIKINPIYPNRVILNENLKKLFKIMGVEIIKVPYKPSSYVLKKEDSYLYVTAEKSYLGKDVLDFDEAEIMDML